MFSEFPVAVGECAPALDVYETPGEIVVVLDLPGVKAATVRARIEANVLVIAGEKPAQACGSGSARFHLAERGFGRFTRAVRLSGAFDASRARATLAGGELRIVIPRIDDRRGTAIDVPIS
jgi:HSP20 family protein